MTPQGAREVSRLLDDISRWDPGVVVDSREALLPGSTGRLPVRVFSPRRRSKPRLPVLIYFHGGGWVVGGHADTEIVSTCSSISEAAGCAVVSVGYSLAPESKFPTAVEDAYSVLTSVARSRSIEGLDPSSVAVGGDSAGGNIAAALCLMNRDRGGPRISLQLLAYPVTDYSFETASYRDCGAGYGLATGEMRWFWGHYLRTPADGDEPYASPLRARDLRGLPPALVLTAEYDPLRDEGEAYAHRLEEAGVPVELIRHKGEIHGFFTLPFGGRGRREAVASLRRAFSART